MIGTLCDFVALGAPRPTGVTTNRFSAFALVGRSSKVSNSVPSPKFRFRVGCLRVSIAAACLRSGSGAIVGVPLFVLDDAMDEEGE